MLLKISFSTVTMFGFHYNTTIFSFQRVMPSSFFLLLRFFLRIDGVLIRMNDTRLYHEVPSLFGDALTLIGSVCAVSPREHRR